MNKSLTSCETNSIPAQPKAMKAIFQAAKDWVSFYGLLLITYPLRFLSYRQLHKIGRILGSMAYHLAGSYKKRTLNNLALAKDLHLSLKERKQIAKESFQNLVITTLEYFRLAGSKNKLDEIVVCDNPEVFQSIFAQGKGIIFLSGHQANWEVPFLYITQYAKGIAIGRPIKNKLLYQWVLSLRQMNGGKVVLPKQALAQGIEALKRGQFVGIVGDQALPESSYSSNFLGRRAFSSSAPGLLSNRTGCPIVVATTRRDEQDNRYHIHCHAPLWPDMSKGVKAGTIQIMNAAMKQMQQSIVQNPGQWLWQHNRWKQNHMPIVQKQWRSDFILLIFPSELVQCHKLYQHLAVFQSLYGRSFFTLLLPQSFAEFWHAQEAHPLLDIEHVYFYRKEVKADLFLKEPHLQLIFDFYEDSEIKEHYLSLGSFNVLTLKELCQMARVSYSYELDLTAAILKALR